MYNWVSKIESALWSLFGLAGRSVGGWVLVFASVLALFLVFARVCHMATRSTAGPRDSLPVAIVGVVGIVVGATVLREWVFPHFDIESLQFVEVGAAFSISCGIVVLMMKLMFRTGLLVAVLSWSVGVAAAVLIAVVGIVGMEFVTAGSQQAEHTKSRAAEMQGFLNDH